jgi:membrane protein
MSWFPELVVGTLSGVISGLVLQKIAPADSGIVLSSDESLSMVNQQIVNVGDGAVTIVGDRNYTHIGDDNSVYVTVSPQRVSNEQTDNGDAVAVLMGTFIALVVVSVLLVKNYELILGILIGLSSALLVLSLIMFVLAIRAQFVSSSLKSALLMSVLGVVNAGVSYWSCYWLSTVKSGLSMPDLARMLAQSSGGVKRLPVGEMFEILWDEGAFPYVVTVFIAMLVSVGLCFFAFGMLLREYCERSLALRERDGIAKWMSDHLPVPGKLVTCIAVVLACVPFAVIMFYCHTQQPLLT